MPPREYDHPYSGHLIVQRMSEPDIRRTCYNNDLKPGRVAIGCALTYGPAYCTILIVTDDMLERSAYDYDLVLRHELGHCNGWRHDVDGKTVASPGVFEELLLAYGKRRAKELGLE